MLRRLSPLLVAAPLALAPGRATARQGEARGTAGPLEPAAPPAVLVSPVAQVEPLAPGVEFMLLLPRREPREPPGAPPPPPEETPEERRERALADDSWLDASHAFIAERVFAPVIAFDRFFSDETHLDPERSRSFLRWRNEVRFERARLGGGSPIYATAVRADLRLPGLNRWLDRLRFVVEGETRDAIAALMPGEGEEPDRVGAGGAELRLRLWEGLIAHGDIGAGFLLQLPPGAFVQARLRWAIPVGELFLTRLSTRGFYRTDTRFGTAVDAHLERGIKRAALLRLSGQTQITEVSRGFEWSTELAALRAFSRTVAASVGVGMLGATDAWPRIDRYRVATRLRSDVYRRWIFLELEPEVSWPWTPERGREPEYAVTLRFELQFRGWDAGERRKERRAPGPREPGPPMPVGTAAARAAG